MYLIINDCSYSQQKNNKQFKTGVMLLPAKKKKQFKTGVMLLLAKKNKQFKTGVMLVYVFR